MKKCFIILLTLVGLGFGFLRPDSVDAVNSQPNAKMMVAPVIEELTLDPAMRLDKEVSVANQGDQALKIRVYTAPYSVATEGGTSDYETDSQYTQIYHWIKIRGTDSSYHDEAEFVIGPQKSISISYRVDVPEEAPGGSQHACIFVETVSDDLLEPGGIVTVSRAAVKLFADVAGDTIRDSEIVDHFTNTLVIDGKVTAKAFVKNIGNVDVKPTLSLKINTLEGETVFENTTFAMVFPENSGELKVEWPETPGFGIYRLVTVVNILGKNSTIEKVIFVFPSWLVIVLLVVIVMIAVMIICFRKKIK